MARARQPVGLLVLIPLIPALVVLGGCADVEAAPDRRVELADPFTAEPASADQVAGSQRYLGTIRFPLGRIEGRRVSPSPARPSRWGSPGDPLIVEFDAFGLNGATGRLGLLAPQAAARQEVAHDDPGQPDDPRSVWVDVEIGPDGPQRFELPAPGPDWHAPFAVIALELRRGRTRLPVLSGPRSEQVEGHERRIGGRAMLALVPIERRPARAEAVHAAAPPTLDGVLDEGIWDRPGARLFSSRTGEPDSDLELALGGPTLVRFAWDASHLYVAGSLPDPDLYAPHRRRDEPLYREEAFEVFVAGDGSGERYLEHQVSARNVAFDARFPHYREGDEAWDGGWRSAVHLAGDLEGRGGDYGWTVELAFPWAELCEHTTLECPPKPGQELRVNVFRLDKPTREGQRGLALSPTLQPDFHAWQNAAELVLVGGEGAQ